MAGLFLKRLGKMKFLLLELLVVLVCVISAPVSASAYKTMTEKDMQLLIDTNGLKNPLTTLHYSYTYTDLEGWKTAFRCVNKTDSFYKPSTVDCVYDALSVMVACKKQCGLNSIGLALGSYRGNNHAFNIFYVDGLGFYIYEPQSILYFIWPLDKISEVGYKIGAVML